MSGMTTQLSEHAATTAGAAATLADIVLSRLGDQHPGLRFDDDSWTWDQVVREAAARASLLTALVDRPADRPVHVGLLLDNVPDFVFWTAGAALAGATVVGINTSRSADELAADIRHADVDLVVTEGRQAGLLAGDHGVPAERVLDVDDPTYPTLVAEHAGAEPRDLGARPEDTAFLMFSSGSTGRPKAVILSNARLARITPVLVERISLRRESTTYLCMPLFHGNSVMMNLVPAMAVGATVGMTRRFSAGSFSADVHRFGATYVNYVGRALSYVLSREEDPRDRRSTLEVAFGTEASEADVARFSERYGCTVLEGYGQSEGVFRLNRTPDTPKGSLGLPPGGLDIRVLHEDTGEECPRAVFDETGRLVDPAAVGQIVAVGMAHAFEGYYRNPEAMADRVRGEDYWSGDLGYRDEAGFFYFAGRSSDWLRVDSENFAAAQVERIIQRHPAIAAAPVFAVADPVTGDRVMCAVELRGGATLSAQELGTFLAEQPDLGAKWWPAFVRLVDALPLVGSGKVDKAPLRREAWATSDPVWLRDGRTTTYLPLDQAGREELVAAFTEHGRAAHLPAGAPPAWREDSERA